MAHAQDNKSEARGIPSAAYIKGFLGASRFVFLTGEITRKSAAAVRRELLELLVIGTRDGDGSPVALLIDSPGGKVDPGWALFDFIRSCCSREIHGIIMGEASSTASVILQACHRRFALPNARALIHHITSDKPVRFDRRRLRDSNRFYTEHIEENARRWERAYTDRGVKAATVLDLMEMGSYEHLHISADEMLRHGLIDGIIARLDLMNEYRPPDPKKTRKRRAS